MNIPNIEYLIFQLLKNLAPFRIIDNLKLKLYIVNFRQ